MINPVFQFVMDRIVRRLFEEEQFYDQLPILGCDFKTWPVCEAKTLALEYIRLRSEGDHQLALVKLYDRLESLSDHDYPYDLGVFKHVYAEAFKKQQVDVLRYHLARDPLGAEKYIAEFKAGVVNYDLTHVGLDLDRLTEQKELLIKEGKSRVVIPGFEELSDAINGFNPSRVGMLVAQTGFGKTTCAINLARKAAEVFPVLYINMEMSELDFAERTYCSALGVSTREFERIIMQDKERVDALRSQMMALPLHFSRGKSLSANDILSIAFNHKEKYGLGMLVIDYDQKILLPTSKETPEWKALQQTLEGLDELSKRLECFILVLAQESADGDVSGSRRSKFPASSVIRFFQDKDALVGTRYVLKLIKNRYGKQNQEIEVNYDGARYQVSEIKSKPIQAKQKSVGERLRERVPAASYTARADVFGD